MIDAYPLCWPEGWPRTPQHKITGSRFNTTMAVARDAVVDEVRLLGGRNIIISTNISLRRDGIPYASAKEPDDRGVACYFDLDGEQRCIPCDKWQYVSENMQAIRKTIGALRGLDRWGAKEMVDAAFRGFAALPPPSEDWTIVLNIPRTADLAQIEYAYRGAAKKAHPDGGGSVEEFTKVKTAYHAAKKYVHAQN